MISRLCYNIWACLLCGVAALAVLSCGPEEGDSRMNNSSTPGDPVSVVFATYAQDDEQLRHACYLAESIRRFAGNLSDAPIWVYLPAELLSRKGDLLEKLISLDVDLRTSETPPEARWFYYSGKVYAAAEAEEAAAGKTPVLVWLDEDTVILQEPRSFVLPDSLSFAYRPVMHNRSGSLYDIPPDPFWKRIYDKLSLTDDQLFAMVTPADEQKIRAYFNAGLLVVRPEKEILRGWRRDFAVLYNDPDLVAMCRKEVDKRIFLHQTALVGAVLDAISRNEMTELSDRYNYPIFFHTQYKATREFETIEDVVTLRYDVYFRNPDPQWDRKLKGPPEVISWLTERLGKE